MEERYSVYAQERTLDKAEVNILVRSVYNWMAIGLLLTGLTAYFTASSQAMMSFIFGSRVVFFGLLIGELVMVGYFAARVYKLSPGAATGLFLSYSVVNGLTLSAIFFLYTRGSLASTFLVTAGTFAAVSLYGYTTKKDLTSLGSFMMMGLFGIIIASVVNMFVHSGPIDKAVTYLGVLIFVGLTAYDTQKIRMMAEARPLDAGEGALRKAALFGALSLYLDFINLFLMLLRLMGDRR